MMEVEKVDQRIARRTLVKGAVWSVPVIAVAVAAPHATASARTVDGYQVEGTCALLGTLGAGFTVTAGAVPIPVGTQIVISTGVPVSVNLVSLSGQGLALISLLSSREIAITLTQQIPSAGQLNIRWLLNVSVLTTTTATLTLPAGNIPGTDVKNVGTLRQTLVLCDAS